MRSVGRVAKLQIRDSGCHADFPLLTSSLETPVCPQVFPRFSGFPGFMGRVLQFPHSLAFMTTASGLFGGSRMAPKKRLDTSAAKTKPVHEARLWLSVLEDKGNVEWPPTIDGQQWRVVLSAASTLQECGHKGLYRTSPVFPVTKDFIFPELNKGIWYLCFYCFDPAFPVLGRLVKDAPSDLKAGLLYTTGLASILLITKKRTLTKQLENLSGVPARAREIWRLQAGRIEKFDCECSSPIEVDPAKLEVLPYDTLPLVPRSTVDEFVASMAVIVSKIRVHAPDEIGTFVRLIEAVNELVSEMTYVCNPVGDPPTTLTKYPRAEFTNPNLCNCIVQQNVDRLVQINAALSYVSTQALSGAVPILDRRSLIRRYTLLGIGTAVLALTRMAHAIERAFAHGALEEVLKKAAVAKPLPGLRRLDYDARRWSAFSVDTLNGLVSPRKSSPKLPYFSGRLGFRESEYTISAALQTVAAGASHEWSFLTVTHEMVHGHVRNLLSTLFLDAPNGSPSDKWNEFYSRFDAWCNGTPPADECLLDSIRAVILSYCCNTVTQGSLTKISDKNGATATRTTMRIWLPSREDLRQLFASECRNISEVFVHVLDLHYFYSSCISHYIKLIWRSWCHAPQVLGDVRQYVLRSLLVIAAQTDGKRFDRFRTALTQLEEHLQSLIDADGACSQAVGQAIVMLKSKQAQNELFFPFSASLILVDLVQRVLTSSAVRGEIHGGDDHLRRTLTAQQEEWLTYDMAEGFVDDRVISPTAYLLHRLTRPGSQPSDQALEAETTSLFLACCSNPIRGALND